MLRAALAIPVVLLAAVSHASPPGQLPAAICGAWAGGDGTLAAFSADAIALREPGAHLVVARILEADDAHFAVRAMGLREAATWTLAPDGTLHVAWEKRGAMTLHRSAREPAELSLVPIAVGDATLPPAEVAKLQAEIAARLERDQAARSDAGGADRDAIDAENARWLRGSVARLGWLDAARFGEPTSSAAITLVRHSQDIALMRAVLGLIERDARAGRVPGRSFAALDDRLRLLLGERQRYGTQSGTLGGSTRYVFAVDDRTTLDARRRALSLPPFAAFVAQLGATHPGVAIVVLEDERLP